MGTNSTELAILLLHNGAKVYEPGDDSPRPLFVFAAEYEASAQVLQAVLDVGADINAQDEAGETALMVSARQHYLSGVKFLLAHHANTAVKDHKGHTALYQAMHPLNRKPGSREAKQIAQLLR